MQHDAGLELSRMVPEIGEERLRIHHLIPVDHAQEQGHRGLELSDHLTEVVPAVSVQDHELRHALAPERRGHVAQHQGLGARVHVETQRQVELAGVHAERHHGQHHHPRAPVPRDARRELCDPLGLDVVGRVGQVAVVRLARPPRQHRDLVAGVAYVLPRQLVQDVRTWGHQRCTARALARSFQPTRTKPCWLKKFRKDSLLTRSRSACLQAAPQSG